MKSMASPAGFEPATSSLEGCCSIQLSYGPVAMRRAGSPAGSAQRQCVHCPTRLNLKLSE